MHWNSLYCTLKNIGKGVEFTLIKGRITELNETYCYIVDIEDTDKKVIISRTQIPNVITDTKEYVFVLEKYFKLFDSEKDNPIFKVKSKGRVKRRSISKKSYIYYIHDFNFHRNFFFSEIDSNYSIQNISMFDYDLHIIHTIVDFKEITNNYKQ